MSDTDKINSQDILNAIDLNKINQNEKKRRGRPKKTQMIAPNPKLKTHISDNIEEQEEDEIILHLPISREDIKMFNSSDLDIDDIIIKPNNSHILNSDNLSSSEKDNSDEKDKVSEFNLKQYGFIIKKLKDENDDLKKYLSEITPMYFTEVKKIYPIDLKLFDMQNNILIPKKTNICCWWCTYQFDCLPTYLPEKYSDNKFYITGCFCSFNCAGSYNLTLNDNKIWERYSLLKQLYYMINKDKITSITDIEINIAGPKELLEKFGGPMNIIEYRKNSKIIGREYHKLMPPFLPITIGFEETTNNKVSAKNLNINSFISSKAENMLIKRNKPVSNIASKHIDNYIE
jgi:hypothetical protein